MTQKFSSSSRLASWVSSWLDKFANDFDKQRLSGGPLLHYAGRDIYPAKRNIVKVEMPQSGTGGIPTQKAPLLARLSQPHAMDDNSHRGMDDLRVRPFSRQAGRKSSECAQYALGTALLAQDSSAEASVLIIDIWAMATRIKDLAQRNGVEPESSRAMVARVENDTYVAIGVIACYVLAIR